MNQIEKFTNFALKADCNVEQSVSTAIALKYLEQYEEIQIILTAIFSESLIGFNRIWFHGSRIVGLASYESDLNVFVEVACNFYSSLDHVEMSRLINFTRIVLSRFPATFNVLESIIDTEVPICRVEFVPSKLLLNICFKDGMVVVTKEVYMTWLSQHDRQVQKFMLFMRNWCNFANSVPERWDLHRVIDSLCFYYLQVQKYLPSFMSMQTGHSPRETRRINGIPVDFKMPETPAMQTMTNYLADIIPFFDFYRKFQFHCYVVAPYVGGTHVLERSRLLEHTFLENQREMLKSVETVNHEGEPISFIILGPVDLSHNLARQFTDAQCTKFFSACNDAIKVLSQFELFTSKEFYYDINGVPTKTDTTFS